MNISQILLLLIALLPVVIYMWYVSIVSRKNKAREALSGIDVQLKKRSEVIPNILKIAQKFMDHEKSLLTEITELRTQVLKGYNQSDSGAVSGHLDIAEKLSGKMGQLMISVENYPDLKSDATMLQAQQSYNEVELQIAASRRFYNSSVNALNNAIQIFPGSMIAKKISVTEMPFYEADEAAKQAINADNLLK